ncbi:hypothetical protein HYALB_00005719 [Hymenoscyphus albidus]|uniref:FCP1 homology domain-containing protein n=1 Tax=Hymenoscyphus albidus TaxID=595503 RepID=A0A9N9LLG9_9HELO|nr:hypothetical protein HYALB_00005719 [Hymenoscyphus albidus]
MNSLNILSARVSPPQTPSPSRSASYANLSSSVTATGSRRNSRAALEEKGEREGGAHDADFDDENTIHEDTPLLNKEADGYPGVTQSGWHMFPKRISAAVIESIRWVLSTFAAPGVYLIACLYDDKGIFAPFSQLRKFGTAFYGNGRRGSAGQLGMSSQELRMRESNNGKSSHRRASLKGSRKISSNSSSSGLSSESESERERSVNESGISSSGRLGHHSRSKSVEPVGETTPTRRSIRIRLHNEDSLRQRKPGRTRSASTQSNGSGGAMSSTDVSPASIKSPTSPASSLLMTKYPRAPAAPRPLIPQRQPSYVLPDAANGKLIQKTLILDLDETLIHSMAKGGRMSTGHMVEVKLNTVVGAGGTATLGPQHPILYYVHKRPHCDDFLRKVCKWYKLVIFTASVQEYADPVIDWLEQERKFFSGRYYRQHCTFRHGAFIKDLSSVEPDLSKVMILDNSPLSYMFHRGRFTLSFDGAQKTNLFTDNAIPIEGWINDPTDNDLLHLVPLLEGLQWVTDVRALLGLRGGEDGKQ